MVTERVGGRFVVALYASKHGCFERYLKNRKLITKSLFQSIDLFYYVAVLAENCLQKVAVVYPLKPNNSMGITRWGLSALNPSRRVVLQAIIKHILDRRKKHIAGKHVIIPNKCSKSVPQMHLEPIYKHVFAKFEEAFFLEYDAGVCPYDHKARDRYVYSCLREAKSFALIELEILLGADDPEQTGKRKA